MAAVSVVIMEELVVPAAAAVLVEQLLVEQRQHLHLAKEMVAAAEMDQVVLAAGEVLQSLAEMRQEQAAALVAQDQIHYRRFIAAIYAAAVVEDVTREL